MIKAKPVLKWAGGKRQLIAEITKEMPRKFGRYIEPFFGGGALFFDVEPKSAIIADANPELINLYRNVRDDYAAVLEIVDGWEVAKECFLRVRSLKFEGLVPAIAAARTLYLNKTCFNGLYRVNRKGEFNSPFGNNKGQSIYVRENIRAVSRCLQYVDIRCGDYRSALKAAKPGDFVFIDPPYLPVSQTADFNRYTKDQFSLKDQIDVVAEVDRLVELGCFVIATNSNHPTITDLYSKYDCRIVETCRHVSAKTSTRRGQDLLIVANGFRSTEVIRQAA
jgi:DNA adenine methylase